jgi:hypothetical protein
MLYTKKAKTNAPLRRFVRSYGRVAEAINGAQRRCSIRQRYIDNVVVVTGNDERCMHCEFGGGGGGGGGAAENS